MKTKLARYLSPAFAAILILLLAAASACASEPPDSDSATDPSGQPSAAAAGGAGTASSPALDPDLVAEFAAAQDAVNADWDRFHVDFDDWRATLSACDRAAAEAALRQFAADFAEITRQARDLPGKGLARELPDNVILAATGEEASLRMLRDNWQPGNPTLLENVQTERANSADLLRAAAIEADKLGELDKPEDREVAKEFADALQPVDRAWDAFYDAYSALADEQLDLAAAEIVPRLNDLVDDHEAVLESLEAIPSDKVTNPVQDALLDAAEAESEALGDLLDALRLAAKSEAAAEAAEESADGTDGTESTEDPQEQDTTAGNGEAANGEGAESEESGQTNGSESGNGPETPGSSHRSSQTAPNAQGGVALPSALSDLPHIPDLPPLAGQMADSDGPPSPPSDAEAADYSTHFDAFEDTLSETRSTRKQARRDLEAIIEGISEADRAALADFNRAFSALLDQWADFHADFDEWVRTEGDCDRAAAIAELNDFNRRFSVLNSRVRDLSQASYLRPGSDLLSEAAQQEGAALRSLAGTWAPYENDVYRGLDDQRANAVKLRRLADRRTQELLERNGLSQ